MLTFKNKDNKTVFAHWWSRRTLAPRRYGEFFSYFGQGVRCDVLAFLELIQGQMNKYSIYDPCKTLKNLSKNNKSDKSSNYRSTT